jgi:hypothetical protein
MEDVHLLSQLSFDLNLLKLEEFINQIILPDFNNFLNNINKEQDKLLFIYDEDILNYNFFYNLFNNQDSYIN